MGTMAFYGPDDKTTTKIAAGVFRVGEFPANIKQLGGYRREDEPKDPAGDPGILQTVTGSRPSTMSDGNMGCPHEEGKDFPGGEDCPFCPFWKGKQGSNQWF